MAGVATRPGQLRHSKRLLVSATVDKEKGTVAGSMALCAPRIYHDTGPGSAREPLPALGSVSEISSAANPRAALRLGM
jgi:hypothetical protein